MWLYFQNVTLRTFGRKGYSDQHCDLAALMFCERNCVLDRRPLPHTCTDLSRRGEERKLLSLVNSRAHVLDSGVNFELNVNSTLWSGIKATWSIWDGWAGANKAACKLKLVTDARPSAKGARRWRSRWRVLCRASHTGAEGGEHGGLVWKVLDRLN